VRAHLRTLEEFGLAVKTTDGRWLRGAADLDKIAEAFKTLGATEATRERHQRQRDGYREALERRKASKVSDLRDWRPKMLADDTAKPVEGTPDT
jgi:hypothetical protein